MKNTFLLFSLLLLAAIPACAGAPAGETTGATEVRTGIEVLRDSGFKGLEGKRVGLVTNPWGLTATSVLR